MRQEKLMIMQLHLDIRESYGNRPAKDQEEYEALAKCHGNTIQWTPTPYRTKLSAWAPNANKALTGVPM